jgi:hypothetical protein
MTYAEIADYRAQTGADVQRALEAAERDVDRATGFVATDETTGLRFDPPSLHTRDATSLRRATVVQAQYRIVMGAEFFIRDQHAKVSGPEFTTEGKLARVSPAVFDELQNGDILKLSTSWGGKGDTPPWNSFAYSTD